jgi:hypothetical protein
MHVKSALLYFKKQWCPLLHQVANSRPFDTVDRIKKNFGTLLSAGIAANSVITLFLVSVNSLTRA